MTGIQPRDESVGNSSDDEETSSTLTKCKRTSERTKYSEEAQSPGHSSDDEPLNKLMESKGTPSASSDKLQESEDEQPLMKPRKKKRKKRKPDTEETEVLDANKTRHPKKDQIEAKASKPRVKAPQKRGRKSKEETRTVHSRPENTTPKKRGRTKKAPSADSSDDEVQKKQRPEMKQAVVLLKRMSKSDVIEVITQGHTHNQDWTCTPKSECDPQRSDEDLPSHKVKRLKRQSKPVRNRTTDASSEDEPLVRRVKAVSVKKKCGKRSNGEEDKKESERGDELKSDSDDEYLSKRKSDKAAQALHRETSSS